MTTPLLEVSNLTKSFPAPRGGSTPVIADVSLRLGKGEFISVLGPSGCGKSTLFNILAELMPASSGEVRFGGERRRGQPYAAYMPQKDLLLPWLTVQDNAGLGLTLQGIRKRDARARVRELLPTFRLEGYEEAYPFELSGGMRQRVALLRTVVQQRPVLLLDEPFGALDYLTRTELQLWLAQMCSEVGLSAVLITHDVPEALLLSDRVYLLSNRPTSVRLVLDQDRPRPRGLGYVESTEFQQHERLLLETLTAAAGIAPNPRIRAQG